jgi:hypothetical protein
MLLKLDLVDNTINLTHEQAEKLGVQEGHVVRVLSGNEILGLTDRSFTCNFDV